VRVALVCVAVVGLATRAVAAFGESAGALGEGKLRFSADAGALRLAPAPSSMWAGVGVEAGLPWTLQIELRGATLDRTGGEKCSAPLGRDRGPEGWGRVRLRKNVWSGNDAHLAVEAAGGAVRVVGCGFADVTAFGQGGLLASYRVGDLVLLFARVAGGVELRRFVERFVDFEAGVELGSGFTSLQVAFGLTLRGLRGGLPFADMQVPGLRLNLGFSP
jgi:hypothetical protein